MEFTIVFLLKGEPKKINEKLIKEVGKRFGESFILESPFPSHITLKSRFYIENIKTIEKILGKFVKSHKKAKIKIDGFSHFKGFVTFLNPLFSKKAFKIQKDLINELESVGIKPSKIDKKFNPHASITCSKTKKNFGNIWAYLKTLDKPLFDLDLDNITIFKRPKKYWKLHKEFKLK